MLAGRKLEHVHDRDPGELNVFQLWTYLTATSTMSGTLSRRRRWARFLFWLLR